MLAELQRTELRYCAGQSVPSPKKKHELKETSANTAIATERKWSPTQTAAASATMLALRVARHGLPKLEAVLQRRGCCAPREVGDNETFLRISSRSWMGLSVLDSSDA